MATQSQRKLERLLEKAEALFWKYGYNGVSVDQIAHEAGISKMTVYKHFPSKEDLFIEVLMKYSMVHTNKIMEIIGQNYHTFDKVECLYTYILQISRQTPAILSKDIMERPNVLAKLMPFKEQKTLEMWRYILEDGIRKGEIRPLDVEFVSNLLLHLPTAFAVKRDYYMDESKRLKMLNSFFDFLKYGLLGSIESPQQLKKEEGAEDEK
ncbi:TetR/AcrR family transcriptional regulator [Candidatus Formimonas warabiya]|uniref:HTH tetR-type domain-containing protein n=1 Tax=Formimonas warabiya TaxID=1761012 RepID=A0A3G1L0A4_FORW1|nr:TetR/AcrR family transcriptional regulator [Candidatus Formimonas warabiya]ATW28078.1 hypothetical protein DCMF_27965 [Candidatus Formimonas warabiya]